MNKPKVIYLAGPYTHPDPAVMEMRHVQLASYAASLFEKGYWVISPITHSHPMAVLSKRLPRSAKFWKRWNDWLLGHVDELRILMLPGWDDSIGVKGEIERAKDLEIPISYVLPRDKV